MEATTTTTTIAKVAQTAPDFTAQAVMPDGTFKEVKLSDYKGTYVCLFFYPLDFTYVCPSEILAFNNRVAEFKAKNVTLLGCSVDSHFCHLAWTKTPLNQGGIGQINFPLVSDLSHTISKQYGVHFEPVGVALRGLFLIDRQQVIRHMVVNDLPLGRSVDEVIRMVDALQYVEEHGEVCPANWKKGEKAMKPSAEGVAEYLVSTSGMKTLTV